MIESLQKLRPSQRRGSKPRCHWIMHGPDAEVAARLSALIAPWGKVNPTDRWMPRGFNDTEEAELHKAEPFLDADRRAQLRDWWFAIFRGGLQRSPNFDLASTCTVRVGDHEKPGLLLVEAKAHDHELIVESRAKPLSKTASEGSKRNHERIGSALHEASALLTTSTGLGWNLSRDNCYQMSNRFAWAAKVAEMGCPVILVYLGFLRADEMNDQGAVLEDHSNWETLVKAHGRPILPPRIWESELPVATGYLIPLIRSVEMPHDCPVREFSVKDRPLLASPEAQSE